MMPTQPSAPLPGAAEVPVKIALPDPAQTTGLGSTVVSLLDELTEKRLNAIEMSGEEESSGLTPAR
jgi:hypothetical protein